MIPSAARLRRSRDLVKGTGNSFEMFAVIAGKTGASTGDLHSFLPALNVLAIPWGSLATSMVYFELVEIERLRPAQPTRLAPRPEPRNPAQHRCRRRTTATGARSRGRVRAPGPEVLRMRR